MTTRENTLGFVGLGAMGAPMVANLLKAGKTLVVYDIEQAKVDAAVKLGAQAGKDVVDVAQRASTVISMVDTTEQAQDVIVGAQGFIQGLRSGDLVISMSTIDPMALKRMHATMRSRPRPLA
jgi:2-hydroxy-3-oxopropionate reductase